MRGTLFAPLLLGALAAPALAQDSQLGIGDAVPAINIEHFFQGDAVAAFDRQKTYVLEFWATWCEPCHKEISELKEVLAEFKNSDIKLILINLKEDQTKVELFMKQRNYPGLILLDKFGVVASNYGVTSLPRLFVIGKDGKLVWQTNGYQRDLKEKMRTVLKKLLL